jgi:hypothetical protein
MRIDTSGDYDTFYVFVTNLMTTPKVFWWTNSSIVDRDCQIWAFENGVVVTSSFADVPIDFSTNWPNAVQVFTKLAVE